MSTFELENEITSLADIAYPNQGVANLCNALVNGQKFGHVFLCGPTGCGKTTIANLLPKAIAPDVDPTEIMIADPANYSTVSIKGYCNNFMRSIGLNSKGKVFIIFDEFGKIPDAAVTALNSALSKYRNNCMAIFISNDYNSVAPTIISRCYYANFSKVDHTNYTSFAVDVLKKHGITNAPSQDIDNLVRRNVHDLRALMRALEDVITMKLHTTLPKLMGGTELSAMLVNK